MRKYLNAILAVTLCALLTYQLTACKGATTQAQINTVVADIAKWTPIIANDADVLLTDVASFEPTDAAAIKGYITTLNTDAATITTLSNQYLAAPNASTLTQISALVGDLATTDSSALIAVLQIKNPSSQALAKGILVTVATAVTILEGYLATVNVTPTPAATKALQQLKPYVSRTALSSELHKAQEQGVAPANVTLSRMGY